MEISFETARNITLILHFVGLASLLGGVLVQLKEILGGQGKIVSAMVHGSWTMLVTGLLLVGIAQMRISAGADIELDHVKVAIKSIVVTAVVFLVMFYRKREAVKRGEMLSIGALTLANVVVAVVL
jgi:hypothetical protein